MNKRIIFSVFALLLLSEYTSAQLKVTSDGKVAVATTTPLSLAKLTIRNNGIVHMTNNGDFTAPVGSTVSIESGGFQ